MRCTSERPEQRRQSSTTEAEARRAERERVEVICPWNSTYAMPERLWEWTATTAGVPSAQILGARWLIYDAETFHLSDIS